MNPPPTTHNPQLIISAPGKIHLLGEHCVVYGYPTLLAAVGKRLYVSLTKNEDLKSGKKNKIQIDSPFGDELIRHAIEIFQKSFSVELPPLTISISTDIPIGAGMGSSAALASAVMGALMKRVKNVWNPTRINELAFDVEKMAHGNPSGADNTVIVFGGLLWYRKEFDFLKSIWSLPILRYKIPRFLLIDTGRPVESTKDMVSYIANKVSKEGKKMHSIFFDQEIQTKKLLLALKKDKKADVKSAIFHGEKNLEKMGVVSDFTKKIIRIIESQGGAAKICGAGGRKRGSGIILCFDDNMRSIRNVANDNSLPVIETFFGEEGIRIEKNE